MSRALSLHQRRANLRVRIVVAFVWGSAALLGTGLALADEGVSEEAPEIEAVGDGRYRVRSTRSSLDRIFRDVAQTVGIELHVTDELRKALETRTPTLDLDAIRIDDLLDYLGGAYGLDPHVRDGRLLLEARAEGAEPTTWSERKEAAIRMSRRALLRYPDAPEAWKAYKQIGDLHMRDRMYPDAISQYRMILGIDAPDEGLAEAKLSLGRAHLANGEPARARFYLTDFTASHPDDPRFTDAYEMIARSFLEEGDPVVAGRALELLLDNELAAEQAARVHRLLGEAYEATGRFDDARVSYGEALAHERDPNAKAELRLAEALVAVEAGRHDLALESIEKYFDEASFADPESRALAWRIAARAFDGRSSTADAFLATERAYTANPTDWQNVSIWVEVLERVGLEDRAIRVLERYVPETSERASVARRLGIAYEKLGRLEKARRAWVAAREDGDFKLEATLALTRILEQQGDLPAGHSMATSLVTEDASARVTLDLAAGRCLVGLERFEDALELYTGRPLTDPEDEAADAATEEGE